ncbi:MAG: phytanoyl-CoA dioxygenase family protein [Phycisphaerales bacterium]|nr:phytanoyl-CoA dioxygenase family protein [Phycisphaerales bacterium]
MLTPDQVRFFHENGFLIMRGIIPQRDLDAMRAAADRLQADALAKVQRAGYLDQANRVNKDWIEHPVDHYVYREKDDGAFSFHRVERLYSQDPIFAQMAVAETLLNNAWQILERPFWPRGGNLVYKLPYEGAAVRWHQDIPYLYWSSGGHTNRGRSTTHPIPNFTTDIYLEPSNRDNGGLFAIPGTHRNGTVDVDKMVAEHGWDLPGAVPLELEPGDAMFHHVAVVHGSKENKSASRRRTFYIHYLTDETIADAYSDWPDLLSAEENTAKWGQALQDRSAWTQGQFHEPLRFMPTPQGLRPTNG